MTPQEAEDAYNAEWPAFNQRKVAAMMTGNRHKILAARRALSALSIKYDHRHTVITIPPTIEEQIKELQIRVSRLESRRNF